MPALPVSALQGGADGTARRRKAGPLRDDSGMLREQPVVLLVSHYQQENCQPTELRVLLGACFCPNLSDL